MNLSSLGLAWIQFTEVYVDKAYRKFSGEPWTCGYGHTGPDVVEGTTCTPEQAAGWLLSDTRHAVDAVNALVKAQISQSMFDALVSLVYNAGVGALEHRSGETLVESTLLKCVNAHDIRGAADQFLQWDHVNGQPSAGLLRRRQFEKALFLEGTTS